MVIKKEKITLSAEQETLLIPLYCKAHAGNPLFVDEKAQDILGRIDYDFAQLKIPKQTCITLCLRAKKIDAYTREFLTAHPRSVVAHLGCGLDGRYIRVDNGEVEWYDLDMPAVIDLRKKFYRETEKYHLIPSSVTDLGWIDTISAQDRPVLIVAGGLLMYLKEAEVRSLLLKLNAAFPGCRMIFDAYSELTAKKVGEHPSLKKTGAAIHWGIDDPKSIERWVEDIHLKEEWFFTQSKDIDKLDWGYRLMFRLAGLFPIARRAHRILYYTL